MDQDQYRVYLGSEHWKALRRQRLEFSHYKCETCGSRYLLQVHHRQYRNIYDVTVADLVTLCRYCHEKQHGINSGIRPIRPDINRLLEGVFHQPTQVRPTRFVRQARGMRKKEIQELLRVNKQAGRKELQRFREAEKIWKHVNVERFGHPIPTVNAPSVDSLCRGLLKLAVRKCMNPKLHEPEI